MDLSKFSNYDELIAELDQLFEFDGELMTSNKNWLIVYTDDEGDMMLVGDDPWQYGSFSLAPLLYLINLSSFNAINDQWLFLC